MVAEAVAGRVVGDRHVGVAAARGRPRPSPRACCGRRRGWCGSGGRPGCRRLDQVRQLAFARRLQLAAALAQLRLDVGVAEALVDALPRSRRASTSPLSVSVMPCSETERPRPTASSRSWTLWALEPVKCCSRLPKASGGTIRRSTEIAVVGLARRTPLGPGLPAAAISGCAARCSASARRVLGGGDQVDVLAGLGPAPRRARDLDPVRGRVLAQRLRQLLGDGQHLREQQPPAALARLAEPLERGEDVLLGLRAEALQLADLLAPRPPPSGPRAWRSPSSS